MTARHILLVAMAGSVLGCEPEAGSVCGNVGANPLWDRRCPGNVPLGRITTRTAQVNQWQDFVECGCPGLRKDIAYTQNVRRLVATLSSCREMGRECLESEAWLTDRVTTSDPIAIGRIALAWDAWGNPTKTTDFPLGIACPFIDDTNWGEPPWAGCSVKLSKSLTSTDPAVSCPVLGRVRQCLVDYVWVASTDDPAPADLPDCDPAESDPEPWETDSDETVDNTCVDEQMWVQHRLHTDAWRDVTNCIERAFDDVHAYEASDRDGDEVCDALPDNCADDTNYGQQDFNCDEVGDACDFDDDNDGLPDDEEGGHGGLARCADSDFDGILDGIEANAPDGNATDIDSDSDGLLDA